MIESEWLAIGERMQACWPHADLGMSTLEVWFQTVRDLPAEQVSAAVEVFHRDGREFPPNGGQLRQKIAELAFDAPQWGEVWPLIRRAQRKAPALAVDPDERTPYLRQQGHGLVADFIEAVKWPEADEWSDDNLESRLRRKWEEWLRDRLGAAVNRGIPPAGLAKLERGDGPRKLNAGAMAAALAPPGGSPAPAPVGASDAEG